MRKLLLTFIVSFLIITSANSQKNWKPFAGINVSASSDFYYAGPSFTAGVIHPIGKKKKWNWVPEIQYFKNSSSYSSNGTDIEWDKFISYSIRSNFNYQTGKKTGKGFFAGGGIGFQKASDECYTITQTGSNKEKNVHYDAIRYGAVMVTINAGYTFPLKKNKLIQFSISTIGPQTAKDYLGTYVEAFSLLTTGVRLVL